MFTRNYCSKEKQKVKNRLIIILLTGWHKNELPVLECALIRRKKRKLLSVPTPKTVREFRYSKSLLFLPIRSELELNGKGCDDRFLEIDRDQQELKVEINERKMFPKRIIKPTRVDPLDALLEALDELSD